MTLQAMAHLVCIQLKSTNYLMWHGQIYPLLVTQQFLPFVDGTNPSSPNTVTSDSISRPNPAYTTWFSRDQLVCTFISSTLSEEAMVVIVGCNTSAKNMEHFFYYFQSAFYGS
ncbi:hypothetical protein ACS0TY_007471 [Phlomoides rotata]